MYYGYPLSEGSGKESFWSNCFAKQKQDDICNIAVYGWESVWYYKERWADYPVQKQFKLPFFASDDQAFYDKVYQLAHDNVQSISKCPFCKKGQIKTSLFGKRSCKSCKAVIPSSF